MPGLLGPPPAVQPEVKTPDQQALDLFNELAAKLLPTAQDIAAKQNHWQNDVYLAALDQLSLYLFDNYRGANWGNFDPDNEPDLQQIRDLIKLPAISGNADGPPTEMDWAPLQSLIDEMKALQTRLTLSCTAAGGKCDPAILQSTYTLVDRGNAYAAVATDNLKTLQASQAAVAAAFAILHKIQLDFTNRMNAHIVVPTNTSKGIILAQNIRLGTDYGATDTGTVSCATDTTPAVPTTDTISYSILYQNVPALTVSAGLLTTFLEKREYGIIQQLDADGVTVDSVFAITDSARASVFPMAYVNYRIAPPILKTWWGEPNNELVISHNLSGGIGINPNTGTNQPEFFVGYAVGFSRSLIHLGLHYGRTESLGGGFSLGKVPMGFTGTTAPIDWSYHPAFGIGVSVRVAPF